MSVRPAGGRRRPIGEITRGTTNPNRLRRADRWLVGPGARDLLRAHRAPLVVDLGYGASPITTLELFLRLRAVHPRVEVLGIEIDPTRVERARPLERPGLGFALGGFEVPVPDGRRPVLVRAFNVLRQYAEADVPGAWAGVAARLTPDGLLVDGTCDEIGRRSTWVTVDATATPRTLTLSTRLGGLETPSELAERLPKALIHRNVPGERIHHLLTLADDAWARQAHRVTFGARQRWLATVADLRRAGVPVLHDRHRWRLGELTVPWSAVAPAGGAELRVRGST